MPARCDKLDGRGAESWESNDHRHSGGTGSGKTTITRRLQQRFADNVSVIYHDNYYKAHNDMTYEERAKLNYDCPTPSTRS